MVHMIVDGTYRQTNLTTESSGYLAKREELRLRLLSAGQNSFKYDLGSEDQEGHQDSSVSVFTREAGGGLRHS